MKCILDFLVFCFLMLGYERGPCKMNYEILKTQSSSSVYFTHHKAVIFKVCPLEFLRGS